MKKIVYYNGNIITVDKKDSIVQAMLIENGIIKALGSDEEILSLDNRC